MSPVPRCRAGHKTCLHQAEPAEGATTSFGDGLLIPPPGSPPRTRSDPGEARNTTPEMEKSVQTKRAYRLSPDIPRWKDIPCSLHRTRTGERRARPRTPSATIRLQSCIRELPAIAVV